MNASIKALVVLFCLILALALSPSARAAGPFGTITVGNWKGGAYTDDKSGAFSHCAAAASYQNGIIFLVSVGQDYSWTLGFAHENWKLTPGEGWLATLLGNRVMRPVTRFGYDRFADVLFAWNKRRGRW